ncbi:MAG: Holliday junction resolvase RuvX [Geminicoccaceae bacterium]
MCDNAKAFGLLLPARGSLLALDVSKRRIGLAGTDHERLLATPLATFERAGARRDQERLQRLVRERQAVGLVLGLPINMDGSEGPMARTARAEAASFATGLALPALLQDERLSTFAVEDAIAEGRLPRPRKGQPVDHYAAMVILEDALKALYQ